METSVEGLLQHKQTLERYCRGEASEAEALEALQELDSVTITRQILSDTRLGFTLTDTRKKGPASVAKPALALVTKWKQQVDALSSSGGSSPSPLRTSGNSTPSSSLNSTSNSTSPPTKRKREANNEEETSAAKRQAVTPTITPPASPATTTTTAKSPARAAPATRAATKATTSAVTPSKVPPPKPAQAQSNLVSKQAVAQFEGSTSVSQRNKLQVMLWKCLGQSDVPGGKDSSEIASEIEVALFKKYNGQSKDYNQKFRTLYSNLKHEGNASLRTALFDRTLSADTLVSFTPEELASPEMRQKRKELSDSVLFDRQETKPAAVEGMFHCRKCGGNKSTFYQLQTRSADEPMTTFITCVTCGNRWKEG